MKKIMKRVIKEGSVRVDLLGGTIDLPPINLIIPDVVTLNLATSLKARVVIEEVEFKGVEIISEDYGTKNSYNSSDFSDKNLNGDFFGNLKFMALILKEVGVDSGVTISLTSGSPPGAGLGGSSAMGVTLMSALNDWKKIGMSREEMIKAVNALEGKMLNCGPAGYQDYYPALYGGVLALLPKARKIEVDQLYSEELKHVLEDGMTLVFSGENRLSGINNWEVYKRFFDKDKNVISGLTQIAKLSQETYLAIKNRNYQDICEFVVREGEARERLFPGIITDRMRKLVGDIRGDGISVGMKACGAGGGGCFLLVHEKKHRSKVIEHINTAYMKHLEFLVCSPISE